PTSPYLATLRRQLQEAQNSIEMQQTLTELMENPMPYPEIAMKDMFGKEQKLSSTLGKVVILDFWTTADANSSLNNAEMKELYTEFAEQGLEIFQVSVDSQKASWVNAVQQQRLPWISVWDDAQINSVINHYALQSVPANFVIDREGNIIGRNVTDDQLRQMVRKALR
ncbi:MAG: TlpA family protein disulfide reductase, partial [Tidjanibacter sp.]|nr:TlpA family protein disulfide reductase [Tidjanibacter sp.]